MHRALGAVHVSDPFVPLNNLRFLFHAASTHPHISHHATLFSAQTKRAKNVKNLVDPLKVCVCVCVSVNAKIMADEI